MTPAEKLSKSKKPKATKERQNGPWACEIRTRRTALRLTIAEVANGVGMSAAALCDIEHGNDAMLTTATKLAKFFGVSINDLWKPSGTEREGAGS